MQNTHKNVLISSGLLVIIALLFFIVPRKSWGYIDDDFGDIYRSATATSRDIKSFFSGAYTVHHSSWSSGVIEHRNAVTTMYRPLWQLWGIAHVKLIGDSPYATFILNIILHLLITLLLFAILTHFTPIPIALFAATAFLFHPSLASWIGRFSREQYHLLTLLVGACVLCWHQWVTTQAKKWFVCSLVIYGAILLTHEQGAILPMWMVLHAWLFSKDFKKIVSTIPFFATTIAAVIHRVWAFGLCFPSELIASSTTNHIEHLKYKFYCALTWIVDLTSASIFAQGAGMIKLVVMVFGFFVFAHAAWKNKTNKWFWSVIGACILLSWPCMVCGYHAPYIYVTLPFLFFGLALVPYPAVLLFFLITAVGGLMRNNTRLTQREHELTALNAPLKHLVQELKDLHRPIIFVAVPRVWYPIGSLAQSLWWYGISNTTPVYVTEETLIFDTTFARREGIVSQEGLIHIDRHGRTLDVYISTTPLHTLWFTPVDKPDVSSVEFEYIRSEAVKNWGKPQHLTARLRPEIAGQNPVIVYWNVNSAAFNVLS